MDDLIPIIALEAKKQYQIELLSAWDESDGLVLRHKALDPVEVNGSITPYVDMMHDELEPENENNFNWDSERIELPATLVNRIRSDAIRDYQAEVYEGLYSFIIRSLMENEIQYARQHSRTGNILDCKVRVVDNNIICSSERTADGIADLLEAMGYCPYTGYYDPEEDKKDGYLDDLTGKWYVTVD